MREFKLGKYTPADAEAWTAFVRESRNGTFLFEREYMDYHQHRITDDSFCVRADGEALVAVFPASRVNTTVSSHGGLTYGGLIVGARLNAEEILRIYGQLIEAYRAEGLSELVVKPVPHIYHRLPCEEELYALHRHGFVLFRRDLSTTIPLGAVERPGLAKGRKWGINRAKKAGYVVAESQAFEQFMELEAATLKERHNTIPVHSGAEMKLLGERFPNRIRLFVANASDGAVDAGVIVYDTGRTVHAQYIAASERGRDLCTTDLIIDHLTNTFSDKAFFDFGISTTDQGKNLNSGLAAYKESFGGRGIAYDAYRLSIGATA